jgi:hypothetical protein
MRSGESCEEFAAMNEQKQIAVTPWVLSMLVWAVLSVAVGSWSLLIGSRGAAVVLAFSWRGSPFAGIVVLAFVAGVGFVISAMDACIVPRLWMLWSILLGGPLFLLGIVAGWSSHSSLAGILFWWSIAITAIAASVLGGYLGKRVRTRRKGR